nr:mitochondrial outer membrane protein iml2 [Quercus suber]
MEGLIGKVSSVADPASLKYVKPQLRTVTSCRHNEIPIINHAPTVRRVTQLHNDNDTSSNRRHRSYRLGILGLQGGSYRQKEPLSASLLASIHPLIRGKMKRFGTWLGGKAPPSATNVSLKANDEVRASAEAMASLMLMMNDDIGAAEEQLSKSDSPFHKLGRAYTLFFRAILGFEKDVMEQASLRLAEAEESAAEHRNRAIRDPSTARQSAIYPVGAEFALCHAEAQLMSAVVAVLNESLTESLKGFYKLRKAFWTLHEINQAEEKYLFSHQMGKASSRSSINSSATSISKVGRKDLLSAHTSASTSGTHTPATDNDDNDSDNDDAFVDASDGIAKTGHKPDHQDLPPSLQPSLANLRFEDSRQTAANSALPESATGENEGQQLEFSTITSDPIDLFIHSGTKMMFGLMQLILSMIPPTFSRLLSLFSFRGDRETGLRMLWSATRFKDSINGALAGLFTLTFHNTAIAYCDILRDDALPKERLKALLADMRELYPKSKLWLLEEARMLAADRQLERAVEVLDQGGKASLRQIEAMCLFERSLNCMFLHRYEECATGFIKCIELNNWSHGLYYYVAGACYIELYRTYRVSDPERAKEYAKQASLYIHKVPEHTGKKRLMARQLPFDSYVLRKITKWEHRAKMWKCDFVDAVGISPLEEMCYFWSGYRRMNPSQLQESLKRLAWFDDPTANQRFTEESTDEKVILALLRAVCLRFLGEIQSAKAMLQENVFQHQLQQLKASASPDTWTLPVAHYEMAVCLWEEAGREGGDAGLLKQSSEEIAKVENWESFDLEARVGLKIATARETMKSLGI